MLCRLVGRADRASPAPGDPRAESTQGESHLTAYRSRYVKKCCRVPAGPAQSRMELCAARNSFSAGNLVGSGNIYVYRLYGFLHFSLP